MCRQLDRLSLKKTGKWISKIWSKIPPSTNQPMIVLRGLSFRALPRWQRARLARTICQNYQRLTLSSHVSPALCSRRLRLRDLTLPRLWFCAKIKQLNLAHLRCKALLLNLRRLWWRGMNLLTQLTWTYLMRLQRSLTIWGVRGINAGTRSGGLHPLNKSTNLQWMLNPRIVPLLILIVILLRRLPLSSSHQRNFESIRRAECLASGGSKETMGSPRTGKKFP